MRKEDLIKKLENIKTPDIEIQSHKRRLRLALLDSGYFKEKTTMSLLKRFAPVGAVAVLALVIVLGLTVLKQPNPTAYAKELINNAQKAVYQLPENAVVYSFSKDSLLEWVEEAKKAPDLKYLGKTDGKKVLSFTDSKGNPNILELDENNIPMRRAITIKDEAGKEVGGVEFGKVKSFEMEAAKNKKGTSQVEFKPIEPSTSRDAELFADLLKNYVAKKDAKLAELVSGNDWKVVKVIRSEPEKTEKGIFVKTITVMLEKAGKTYEIVLENFATGIPTVKSIAEK